MWYFVHFHSHLNVDTSIDRFSPLFCLRLEYFLKYFCIFNNGEMGDGEGDPDGGKKIYIVTGNTPHKPEDKRRRFNRSTIQSSAVRL